MTQSFKLYRIVCTINDKAFVGGSDHPHHHLIPPQFRHLTGQWHERGTWTRTGGTFWKGENTARSHLQALCHDWDNRSAPARYPRYEGQRDYWRISIAGPFWERLNDLVVEQFLITEHSVIKLPAHDFMGIPERAAA